MKEGWAIKPYKPQVKINYHIANLIDPSMHLLHPNRNQARKLSKDSLKGLELSRSTGSDLGIKGARLK